MPVEKIKKVALRLFATKGYENTTTREIGRECGMKGASLYTHFKSKEEIFMKVLEDVKNKLMLEHHNNIKEVAENRVQDYKRLLYNIFRKYLLYFLNNEVELLFWQRVRIIPPFNFKEKFDFTTFIYGRQLLDVYYELFERGIKIKQIRKHDINTLVLSYLNLINGYYDSIIMYGAKYTERQLEQAFDLYWEGIKFS